MSINDKEKQTSLISGITQETLPIEYINAIEKDFIENSKLANPQEEINDLISKISVLDLFKKEDMKTFFAEMKRVKPIRTKGRSINLPKFSKITCDYSGETWFMLNSNTSVISLYDINKIKDIEGKYII